MTTNEEKIKAFLNDEEKVKALANDTEFLEKVSGGQATNETYEQEFKKFDIELSDQDAEKTKDVVQKMLEKTPEVVDEKFLKGVVGGGAVSHVAAAIAGSTFISGLGCGIASCVYTAKANKARAAGNNEGYENFIKKSLNCGIASAALVGTAGIAHFISARTSDHAKDIITARNMGIALGRIFERYNINVDQG